MEFSPVSLIFGVALFILGSVLIRMHIVSWRMQKHDADLDDGARKHYYNRYRRRMQTSGLIVLLGVIIPLELLIESQESPVLFTAYCVVVLVLSGWIVLLGIADIIATKTYTQGELARIRGQQLSLERQLSEMKSRGSNGHYDR